MATEQPKPAFVPAVVVSAAASPNALPIQVATRASGRMVIELGNDRRIIVDVDVDAAALSRVLGILERR
ncbi:IS66 family insertion sequence element accessory protein TnpB [Bradyrhizobium sp. WSM471]|uniref:IS66 family insertion sequence element accessory protein TnpB n=1 Tax=Bradyrhizobium sp. WSM471 TaxID=319017 RepID=UPI001E3EE961|nr:MULTISPECIES: IS66 family insertion sequence element accessory protein TnpB [Bradyrhizobium]UFW43517.1 IS66 family insertion sequence element accessory protein TnpB [Bradyrhizobium canariense]